MIEGQTQQPGVGSGLVYNRLTPEQLAADSPELLAYWTWRKLAALNWGNISGEIDTAIKHALLRWGAAAADYVARETPLGPRSSAAPGSAALVDCKERIQIRSGLPGGGVVMVRMQTSASTGTTQLLDMGEAAWLVVALAEAIREAMPPND
jgi:hypothetical protein